MSSASQQRGLGVSSLAQLAGFLLPSACRRCVQSSSQPLCNEFQVVHALLVVASSPLLARAAAVAPEAADAVD